MSKVMRAVDDKWVLVRPYLTTLTLIGVLVSVVAVVSWFVFPAWGDVTGGIWLLLGAAGGGVVATVLGILSIHEKLHPTKKATGEVLPAALTTGPVFSGSAQQSGETNIIATGVDAEQVGGTRVQADQVQTVGTHIEQATFQAPPMVDPVRALHQLPPIPPRFTGRAGDIEQLFEALKPVEGSVQSEVAISGVRGMGGVGKTALGLAVANRLIDHYPDAQIYLDLRGASDAPMTPAQAMSYTIRAFEPEAQLPDDETQLTALYRSVLAGKRVLLFFDNASNAEQVTPLIPPAACALLTTSRLHFSVGGVAALSLDALPPEEAHEFLRRLYPTAGDAGAEIASALGYLPIALEFAGNLLANRPDESAQSYLARLLDGRTRLEIVEASLSLSYEMLDTDAQRRWEALSIFPEDFDVTAADAVWAMGDVERTRTQLGEFLRLSLLTYLPVHEEYGRYRLHDLLRDFAQEHLHEEELGLVQLRHAEHFRAVLGTADALYLNGADTLLTGLQQYDRERSNILAGQKWAAQFIGVLRAASDLAIAYPDAGAFVTALRMKPRERAHWLSEAVRAAREIGEHGFEASALGNLGVCYRQMDELEKAIDFFEESVVIARESGERRCEGNGLGNLGIGYFQLGESEKGIGFFEEALDIAREIGNRRGEANALGNLGNAYAHLDELEKAIDFFEKTLDINREIGNREGEGNSLSNLGKVRFQLGESEKGIGFFEEALDIAREIGDRRGEANALLSLGTTYALLGESGKAIGCLEETIQIGEELKYPSLIQSAKSVLAPLGQSN